jgi:hypothetical protein
MGVSFAQNLQCYSFPAQCLHLLLVLLKWHTPTRYIMDVLHYGYIQKTSPATLGFTLLGRAVGHHEKY